MTNTVFLNVRQVAAALGVSTSWFRKHRQRLFREGFPLPDRAASTPHPVHRSELTRPRWRATQVRDFIENEHARVAHDESYVTASNLDAAAAAIAAGRTP